MGSGAGSIAGGEVNAIEATPYLASMALYWPSAMSCLRAL